MRALLLILVLTVGTASSSEPQKIHGARGQQKSNAEQIGSENSPVFIKGEITTRQDKGESDGAEEERQLKSEVDAAIVKYTRWLAILTGLLFLAAAIQAGLFVWQLRLMNKATYDAGVAAKAAERAASIAERALTELERPYVYAAVSKPGLKFVSSQNGRGSGLERSELEVRIYNFGRTPANLTRLEYSISLAEHGDIVPAIDPKVTGGRELPVGTIASNGDPYFETTNLRLCFISETNDIIENKQSVWVVGFVRYDDIFCGHHITGFAQVLDLIGGRFVRRGGEEYNYARNEELSEIPPPS